MRPAPEAGGAVGGKGECTGDASEDEAAGGQCGYGQQCQSHEDRGNGDQADEAALDHVVQLRLRAFRAPQPFVYIDAGEERPDRCTGGQQRRADQCWQAE